MKTVVLIHWRPAEALARMQDLRDAGYTVRHAAPQGQARVRDLRRDLPHAFVIDLTRLPSQGTGVATLLRGYAGTRGVPLVFAGGEAAKVDRIRALFPDAVYTPWESIAAALAHAFQNAPASPVKPGIMAGYSGTPLPKKLGIRPGSVVWLAGAPDNFEEKLSPLPEGAQIRRRAGSADRILLFVRSAAQLEQRFDITAPQVTSGGGLWIIWPKRASGIRTDIVENEVRSFALERGWVDYKVCAVDETWSGLLFARRGAAKKTGRGTPSAPAPGRG
jgi:hypothetical protein